MRSAMMLESKLRMPLHRLVEHLKSQMTRSRPSLVHFCPSLLSQWQYAVAMGGNHILLHVLDRTGPLRARQRECNLPLRCRMARRISGLIKATFHAELAI